MRGVGVFALALALMAAPAVAVQSGNLGDISYRITSPSPAGLWMTANHNAVVRVLACGQDLCGQVVGLAIGPHDPMPKDWRGQPQCGLTIFEVTPAQGDGQPMWKGTILDPRSGSEYGAEVKLAQPAVLELRGYLGLPIFGETQSWTPFYGQIGDSCRIE
jgi:uncharacterized protein (DUF2147 family)